VVLALEWVRDNAAAFGGDASNVTIFGESGGGAKVSTMLGLPAAKGLFHRAVIRAGPDSRHRAGGRPEFTEQILAKLEIPVQDARKLQQVPAEQLFAAVNSLPPSPPGTGRSCLELPRCSASRRSSTELTCRVTRSIRSRRRARPPYR